MAIGSRSSTLTLFTEYYERKFVAHDRSWSSIFHLLLLAVIIILPFILTFQSGTFWSKQDTYQEQPLVQFTNDLFIQMTFTNTTSKETTQYIFSTSRNMNNEAQNLLNSPTISSSFEDNNRDGLNERYNLTIRVRKPASNLVLSSVTVIAGFNYETSNVVQMIMNTLAILQVNIPTYNTNPVISIKSVGSLDLKQLYPLRRASSVRTLYNDDLFSYLEYETISTFLDRYTSQRNETTTYNYEVLMKRGLASQNYIDINMIVNIPTYQDIQYIPGVWEVLKFAWIQYYSFLILIYVFLYHFFYGYVIKNKVYESIELNSINLNNVVRRYY